MNARAELEAVGMAGGGRHRHPGRDRLGRPGPVAHAGVAVGDLPGPPAPGGPQHGPGPGRLLPGHPGRRPRRLPPHRAGAEDVAEGVELVQLAFHLAFTWRNPVLVYGDYLLAHTQEAVAVEPVAYPPLPPKDWAVDGRRSGSGESGNVTPLGVSKHGQTRVRPGRPHAIRREQDPVHRARGARRNHVPRRHGDGDRRVRHTLEVRPLHDRPAARSGAQHWDGAADRASGPSRTTPSTTPANARMIGSFELSAGQMIDDVRIGAAGHTPWSSSEVSRPTARDSVWEGCSTST